MILKIDRVMHKIVGAFKNVLGKFRYQEKFINNIIHVLCIVVSSIRFNVRILLTTTNNPKLLIIIV